MRSRYRVLAISGLILLLAGGCSRGPQHALEVVAVPVAQLPLDAAAPEWQTAPVYTTKLLPQDLVEPRLMKPSTAEVQVRALASSSEIALRLQWTDATVDDVPGPGRFLDACAVQLPKTIDPNLPDPQMGQSTKPVQITFWRADWQASVNGRADNINAIYPNATVDHYPFQAKPLEGTPEQKEMAKRYAPAEAVDNRRAGPRETPVEDLVAEGPGTLSPAPAKMSRGQGAHGLQGWSVVIVRPLPTGLGPATRTQVAFAVWEGSHDEAGARKMRSGWAPLSIRGPR